MRHFISMTLVPCCLALATSAWAKTDQPNIVDPFERADHEGMGYGIWRAERMFALAPVQARAARWLKTFEKFPPRQKPALFSLGNAMEKIQQGTPHN